MGKWIVYDDIGRVYEIFCLYDDVLKKNDTFINYAVKLANRILESEGLMTEVKADYGRWGARINPNHYINKKLSDAEIEFAANLIERHPCWQSLKYSTFVFTYGVHGDKEE
jgi:hypothetical protein